MSKLEEEIKLKLVSEMDSTKRHLMNVQTFSGNEGLYRYYWETRGGVSDYIKAFVVPLTMPYKDILMI